MTVEMLLPALASIALVAVSLPALAESSTAAAPGADAGKAPVTTTGPVTTKGPNLKTSATGSNGAVATLALAQDLYTLGRAKNDALTVLTAARLAGSVEVKEAERKKETKGEPLADQTDGVDAPVDAATMLASAKELAGEDETLTGLIEDVVAEGSRGRIGGTSSTLSRLPAGQSDVWEIPFYGDSYAELAVLGDGDANLDVLVTDENGNTICNDVGWSDKIYCDFVPSWNGYFYVTVQNNGSSRNSYYLMTN